VRERAQSGGPTSLQPVRVRSIEGFPKDQIDSHLGVPPGASSQGTFQERGGGWRSRPQADGFLAPIHVRARATTRSPGVVRW
jgi:hypothetical protein